MYGQQCRSCDNDEFRNPRWYREEVTKVLNNVHQKIGEVSLTQFHRAPKDSKTRLLKFLCSVLINKSCFTMTKLFYGHCSVRSH